MVILLPLSLSLPFFTFITPQAVSMDLHSCARLHRSTGRPFCFPSPHFPFSYFSGRKRRGDRKQNLHPGGPERASAWVRVHRVACGLSNVTKRRGGEMGDKMAACGSKNKKKGRERVGREGKRGCKMAASVYLSECTHE